MANVRDLKKDVDYVISEIVIECLTYNYIFPDKEKEKLANIIAESVELKEELIVRINKTKHDSESPKKKQFKDIRSFFNKRIEDIVVELGKLNRD
jgi:hypothetical protein